MNVKPAGGRPWRMFLPLALVLVLAIGWSGYWFAALSVIREEVAARRQSLTELELKCSAESWGGFPFRFSFTCLEPEILGHGARLRAGKLDVIAQAYNPWHLVALIEGPTAAKPPDGPGLTATHDTARASIRFRDGPEPEVSIEIPRLDVPGWLTAEKLLLHGRPEPYGARGVALSAAGVNYQPTGRPPLLLDGVEFLATLTAGPELDVKAIELRQGPVIYKGKGVIALDAQRRLSGILSTETNDLDGLLAILDPHLAMSEQQRRGFAAMLRLLGQNASVDIIARDGELFIGPFKVADLVPLY